MRAIFAYRAFVAIAPVLVLVGSVSCVTHRADAAPQELKSERPQQKDDLKERTKPEPPPDKPLDDLRIEPLRTA